MSGNLTIGNSAQLINLNTHAALFFHKKTVRAALLIKKSCIQAWQFYYYGRVNFAYNKHINLNV